MKKAFSILAVALAFSFPIFPQSPAPIVHRVPIMVHAGRIYTNGNLSGKKVLLLVDTGAVLSVFPFSDVPPHSVAPKNMTMKTAAGTADCARVESSVQLEALNETTPVSTQIAPMYCSVSKFGVAEGLLGSDVLLNGRYSSVTFDLQNNLMILVEKQ